MNILNKKENSNIYDLYSTVVGISFECKTTAADICETQAPWFIPFIKMALCEL